MSTEQELKRALITRLTSPTSPNSITFKIDDTFEWDRNDETVLDTEWLHICGLIESSLNEQELDFYVTAVLDWAKEFATLQPSTRLTITQPWGQYVVRLTWQQRAEILVHLGLIEL